MSERVQLESLVGEHELPPNPYAFPRPSVYTTADQSSEEHGAGGMELRDYFAAQALIGVITQSTIAEVAQTIVTVAAANGVTEHDVMARAAYRYADAMLTERQKGGG